MMTSFTHDRVCCVAMLCCDVFCCVVLLCCDVFCCCFVLLRTTPSVVVTRGEVDLVSAKYQEILENKRKYSMI